MKTEHRIAKPKEVLTKCHLAHHSKREKMLVTLLERRNRFLSAKELSRTVYGRSNRTGPLNMVAIGLAERVRESKTNSMLKKQRLNGELHYGLFSK